MHAHIFLTLLTVAMLSHDDRAFEDQAQRFVEVGSEFVLLLSSIMLCMFVNAELDDEQKQYLEWGTLGMFGVLVTINVGFIIWYVWTSFFDKRRYKKWEKRK